jgi:4-phytase / acid phosphatase
MHSSLRSVQSLLLAGFALFATFTYASAADSAADSDLKFVFILTRHGVRAPLDSQQDFGKYSAQPWPKWDVGPGEITAHGRAQMEHMGAYYRARFVREGLLTGDSGKDEPAIYFRANSDQRTIETARSLATTLIPGREPAVHARPIGDTDPLFRPLKLPVGRPDRNLGVAAVLGRVGGDIRNLQTGEGAAFETLERILVGESREVPVGTLSLLSAPAAVVPGDRDNTVTLHGPLKLAGSMTDVFMLEYANGFPLSEVGWGRATPERISQLLALHAQWFDLVHGTNTCARAEGSNMTSHLLATLAQAATGKANPAAIGPAGQKVVVAVGHDTTQITVGSLLRLSWWLPATNRNPVLLGGALVFELRERRRDHQPLVYAYYLSQSLEDIRNGIAPTLDRPPQVAAIFIPGCSEEGPGYPAPLAKFATVVQQAIDPAFTIPTAD